MVYITDNRPHAPSLAQRLARARHTAVQAFANWRTYRTTLNELQSLSMREMADLGINPSMVKRLALEAAYGTDV